MKRIFEDKSCYKIELEMELVEDFLLLLYPNINLLILSYFENKMKIPLLFFKYKKEMIEKLEREFFKTLKSDAIEIQRNQI